MCGIIGVIGNVNSCQMAIASLKKLEYRGYDSSGLATIEGEQIKVIRKQGKISQLQQILSQHNFTSKIAICHTRWATHGKPSDDNSHPHCGKFSAVVHNGIIENFQELKNQLVSEGINFLSQTDTEVLPHLFEKYFTKNAGNINLALLDLQKIIKGTYAIAIILANCPDLLIVAKQGSPLVIGKGEGCNFIASDYYGIAEHTNKIINLEDGEFALITANEVSIFNKQNQQLTTNFKILEKIDQSLNKGEFAHFMLKEIYEQPKVIAETIETYLNLANNSFNLPNFNFDINTIDKITIVACGTSYYAGLIGKYLLETIANIAVEVDIASEFRYRNPCFSKNNLVLFISQSGETADTLAALKYAIQQNQQTLAIVNVLHSNIAQLAHGILRTVAGPEIGVASTKAYTAQITVLAIFALYLASIRAKIDQQQLTQYLQELVGCIAKSQQILNNTKIADVAQKLTTYQNIIYTGRLISHITSLEAALKFRELTYINAYGIAAGELKHGTIALIDDNIYTVAIACNNPQNHIFEKTISNLQEIKARNGKIIALVNEGNIADLNNLECDLISMPNIDGYIQEAILPIIPLQLLSYHVALLKGNDIDQPRNLAKSVTVE